MSRRPNPGNAITPTEYAALRERIARLIRLRLIANTLIPVSTWLAIVIGRASDERLRIVFWVGAALLGLDLIFVLPHRWFARRSYTAAVHATYLSAHLSVLMITVLLHLTGGFANPLVIFYVLNALAIAIVLQQAQAASILLTSSIIAYFALAVAELSGLYPPITWPQFGVGLAPFLPLVVIGITGLAAVSSRLLGSLVETNRALEHPPTGTGDARSGTPLPDRTTPRRAIETGQCRHPTHRVPPQPGRGDGTGGQAHQRYLRLPGCRHRPARR